METDASLYFSKLTERPTSEIKQQDVITVEKLPEDVEVFTERQDLLISPIEYPRNGKDPGLVLIFNQENFENNSRRAGSRKDVNEIIITMSRLGFNINNDNIFNDLTRDEILNTITKLVAKDLSHVNSLIVFFLTHGDTLDKLLTRNKCFKTNDLWKEFVTCKDLKNKPKMFIFQACKGDKYSTISSKTQEKIELVSGLTFTPDYIGPDMLIVYSTTEGNVSFRHPTNGSWFIQELCKNFSAYGRRDDVISLIIRTTKCLCRNYSVPEKNKYDEDVVKKQMPIFISTLQKKFYLNRSKDRNAWIKLLENQESLKNELKEVKEKVSELLIEKEKKNKSS